MVILAFFKSAAERAAMPEVINPKVKVLVNTSDGLAWRGCLCMQATSQYTQVGTPHASLLIATLRSMVATLLMCVTNAFDATSCKLAHSACHAAHMLHEICTHQPLYH